MPKPVYEGEPIQWHLDTTKYDRCTECGHPGPLIMTHGKRRMCRSSDCDAVFYATAQQRREWEADLKASGRRDLRKLNQI